MTGAAANTFWHVLDSIIAAEFTTVVAAAEGQSKPKKHNMSPPTVSMSPHISSTTDSTPSTITVTAAPGLVKSSPMTLTTSSPSCSRSSRISGASVGRERMKLVRDAKSDSTSPTISSPICSKACGKSPCKIWQTKRPASASSDSRSSMTFSGIEVMRFE